MLVAFTPEQAQSHIEKLVSLSIDAVASGASVGFMPPLGEPEARDYWRGVVNAMREGSRILSVALDENVIQGSVQIGLEMRANGIRNSPPSAAGNRSQATRSTPTPTQPVLWAKS